MSQHHSAIYNMDHVTCIQSLKDVVEKFCRERDWDQFHSPKDLAIGVSTEAAELLEIFRFKSDLEIEKKLLELEFRKSVESELADVFFFILRFAQKNNLDLAQAFQNKIKVNNERYPVLKAKGSNKKYNEE